MFENSHSRSEAFAKIQDHLSTKTGPLRLERIPKRLWAVEWADMSFDDRHVVAGVVARLGWVRQWPYWFAPGREPPLCETDREQH